MLRLVSQQDTASTVTPFEMGRVTLLRMFVRRTDSKTSCTIAIRFVNQRTETDQHTFIWESQRPLTNRNTRPPKNRLSRVDRHQSNRDHKKRKKTRDKERMFNGATNTIDNPLRRKFVRQFINRKHSGYGNILTAISHLHRLADARGQLLYLGGGGGGGLAAPVNVLQYYLIKFFEWMPKCIQKTRTRLLFELIFPPPSPDPHVCIMGSISDSDDFSLVNTAVGYFPPTNKAVQVLSHNKHSGRNNFSPTKKSQISPPLYYPLPPKQAKL